MMNTISFDQSHFCQSHFFFPSSDLTSIHRDTNFLGERNRITIQLRSITTIEVNFTLIALISIRSDAGMHSCFSERGGTLLPRIARETIQSELEATIYALALLTTHFAPNISSPRVSYASIRVRKFSLSTRTGKISKDFPFFNFLNCLRNIRCFCFVEKKKIFWIRFFKSDSKYLIQFE